MLLERAVAPTISQRQARKQASRPATRRPAGRQSVIARARVESGQSPQTPRKPRSCPIQRSTSLTWREAM
jgi:hypothetical protein